MMVIAACCLTPDIFHFLLSLRPTRPGAEIGRQACLRGMCPIGREGSSPSSGTLQESFGLSGAFSFLPRSSTIGPAIA